MPRNITDSILFSGRKWRLIILDQHQSLDGSDPATQIPDRHVTVPGRAIREILDLLGRRQLRQLPPFAAGNVATSLLRLVHSQRHQHRRKLPTAAACPRLGRTTARTAVLCKEPHHPILVEVRSISS